MSAGEPVSSVPEFGIYESGGQQYMKLYADRGSRCRKCAFLNAHHGECTVAPCNGGYFIRLEVDDAHGEQQHP